MLIKVDIKTENPQQLLEITDRVREAVSKSGMEDGRCLIYCPHTTAGLTINSNQDPNTLLDLQESINRLVPTRLDFIHTADTPQDAAGHIKSTIVGCQLDLIISRSSLIIGDSQGIFFWEFDGPRNREIYIKLSQ